MSVQVRRGTNADRTAVAGVLASGEFYWCTDTKKLWVGDGSTSGGIETNDTSYQNQFNVLLYGAAGDGVTDDYSAINDAIAAAKTAGGGVVYFPPKTYAASAQIAVSSADNISLSGYGAKIVCTASTSGAMIAVTECDKFGIYGLELDGDSLAQWGCDFKGCSGLRIVDAVVHNMEDQAAGNYAAGIRVGNNSGVGGSDIKIERTTFKNISGPVNSAARGLVFYTFSSTGNVYLRDISIVGCHFEEISPVDDGDGLVFQQANSAGARLGKSINASVTGCTFHNCYKRAIKVQNEGVTVTGCTITTDRTGTWGGSSWSGMQFSGISLYEDNCTVCGNTFTGLGSGAFQTGIDTDGSTADLYGLSITDNVVVNGTDATGEASEPYEQAKGIAVARSSGGWTIYNTTVSGNTIGYANYGIWVGYNVSGCAVTGNTVYGHVTRALHFFVSSTTIDGVFASGNNLGNGFKMVGMPASGMSNSALDLCGSASPEGQIAAPVGSTFRRTDGGASTSLYVKESGLGNTGWVAK